MNDGQSTLSVVPPSTVPPLELPEPPSLGVPLLDPPDPLAPPPPELLGAPPLEPPEPPPLPPIEASSPEPLLDDIGVNGVLESPLPHAEATQAPARTLARADTRRVGRTTDFILRLGICKSGTRSPDLEL